MAEVKVKKFHHRLLRDSFVSPLVALLVCGSLAALAVIVFGGQPNRDSVPLVFISVVVWAAIRWGRLGAISGLLCAAVVFAYFLFEPVRRLGVSSASARANLGWMILFGIVAAFLLGQSPVQRNSSHRNEHEAIQHKKGDG